MNISSTGMSDATERAILAMPVTDDQSILGWLSVLRAAMDTGHDSWEAFESAVRHSADAFDAAGVDAFLQTVAAEHGVDLIRELLDVENQMPDLYWTVHSQTYATEAAGGDPFGWVTEQQRAALTEHLGSGWPETLSADLDQRWGQGWAQHPDEHKTAWLNDLIAGGAFAAAAAGSTSDDPFGWVSESQRSALQALLGAGWTEHLPADLSQRWGADWAQHPDEHKTAWLQDLIADGALAGPAPESAKPATYEQILAAAMEVPGFAELSEAEAAEVIADALEKAGSQ
jgi:hypothetical protein